MWHMLLRTVLILSGLPGPCFVRTTICVCNALHRASTLATTDHGTTTRSLSRKCVPDLWGGLGCRRGAAAHWRHEELWLRKLAGHCRPHWRPHQGGGRWALHSRLPKESETYPVPQTLSASLTLIDRVCPETAQAHWRKLCQCHEAGTTETEAHHSVPSCHEVQGYMPGRLEFETEYENDADNDDQGYNFYLQENETEIELQVTILNILITRDWRRGRKQTRHARTWLAWLPQKHGHRKKEDKGRAGVFQHRSKRWRGWWWRRTTKRLSRILQQSCTAGAMDCGAAGV